MQPNDSGQVSGTPLARFARHLVRQLRVADIPSHLKSEADLEQRVLIPLAVRVAAKTSTVRLFVHPFRKTDRCQPDRTKARVDGGQIVLGCSTLLARQQASVVPCAL
jgi:hypothetical protein